MYKIGDFSRLGQVSVRMLRHYDQIDLLKPDDVDPVSGYRSYSIKQLPSLNRIIFLKDIGFSLIQVKDLLHKDLSFEELKAMHVEKQETLEKELSLAKQQLDIVRIRLEQIENEGKEPLYEVVEKKSSAFILASVRSVVPKYEEIARYCQEMHSQLYSDLDQCGIEAAGPEITFYHNSEYTEFDLDVEIGVRLSKDYTELKDLPDGLEIKTIPSEARVASLLYKGPYEGTVSGVLALLKWIGLNHWNISGPVREIQLSGPTHDENGIVQSDPVTELQIPIEN